MNVRTYVRTRVDATRIVPALAIGDVLAISAFVVVGMSSHGISAVDRPVRFVGTAVPFLVGWAVAAVALGLYRRDAAARPVRTVVRAVPAWAIAAAIGQAIRATDPFPGDAALVFFLVTLAFGGLIVVGWRVVAAVLWSVAGPDRR